MEPSLSRTFRRQALAGVLALLVAGCGQKPPQVLGTLEWDRIALPAPADERIVAIHVREGQQVQAGTPLLELDPTRTRAQLEAAQALERQNRELLDEREHGPRAEQIAQARASLSAAQAEVADAEAYYRRLQPLGQRRLVAASEVDRARAAAGSARAQVRVAEQALLELQRGTRPEQVAQAGSALAAATAQAQAQAVLLQKLELVAPRAGRVDSLPYRLGDQAAVGASLAVLLVGDRPYARVYVPETLRAGVKVGDAARIYIDGREQPLPGRVRMIRSEPVFTPYYALTGADAARLSYLAEVSVQQAPTQLPAGIPVRVEFDGGR
ncbi:HlyD family efflux transporter periplasmic adaptor subunit [Stenotrophomonas sp. MMGLT7]|uniref:HlyD family secretion protein n=1 Tax=Stenotrophomonas sp. MMGLT7 TaxID=2901227 RepID=UPI001E60C277|nr:HlyD family efflux transporter periplasmic adaptor subunit [Stenotrophomonas sp. MMGLT7]MCD7098906.1 HlyD family efflux transporter periplasmic adaptor subunit [Stenotrophomonas sp. MMGLT7]